jgi:hypothetical protein
MFEAEELTVLLSLKKVGLLVYETNTCGGIGHKRD